MRKIYIIGMMIVSSITLLQADSSDWQDNSSWGDSEKKEDLENTTFKQMEIKNRSKREYKDKVYKYIKGNYEVENNNIELATIELNDKLQNSNIEINVLADDVRVEGNIYKDSIKLKYNKYKHFVNHDEATIGFENEDKYDEDEYKDKNKKDNENEKISTTVIDTDPLYNKVKEDDVSELEVIDLRNKQNIKEVNVYIDKANIHVKN